VKGLIAKRGATAEGLIVPIKVMSNYRKKDRLWSAHELKDFPFCDTRGGGEGLKGSTRKGLGKE